ncbi:hypothetical protein FNV43_RR17886 [Rhamnella rubrinervis]|uniref:Protein kinase domain-containing protein n=1 Tax=Rhamnella rubrinervis TaxID=2594499 RepID=A0A8K0E427_9ROSA|nr:hypothetical protein FNV43_RR17886 [Rhamnella rubrinervis]
MLQLLNLCVISLALAVQGSTGFHISPSPEISSVIPPVPGVSSPVHNRKSFRSHARSSVPQPIGSVSPPALAFPPALSAPLVPSLPPSTPTVLPPYNTAPPSITFQAHAPFMAPTVPHGNTPVINAPPISIPVAPVPVATPSGNSPKVSPAIHSITPETSPSSGHQSNSPDYKVPIAEPVTPVSVASPPRKLGQSPPAVHETSPQKAPSMLPVPVATPSGNSPKVSPAIHSITPETSPSSGHQRNSPDYKVPIAEPVTPVSVASPPRKLGQSPPAVHEISPQKAPSTLPGNSPQVSPVIHSSTPETSPSSGHQRNSPDNKVPIAEPLTPVSVASPPRKLGQSPPAVHEISPQKAPSVLPGPVASPTSEVPQNSQPIHSTTPAESPLTLPDHDVPSVSSPPPRFNWKGDGIPVAAPSNKTLKPLPVGRSPANGPTSAIAPSKQNLKRHSNIAPAPLLLSPDSHNNGYHPHPPAPSPSLSFYKHHHTRNKSSSPAPASSYLVSPPTSRQQGSTIPPASQGSRQIHAPPPLIPGSSASPSDNPFPPPLSYVSPAPSPSQKAASGNTKISPSQSSSKSPKVPLLPPLALPPPPPNEDCSGTICTEPYTNTPPGSPCGCVLPIQVGLRLKVALYTFFPLVSELAKEIAAGVFVRQSQVRIIGANAADQQPEKTVVLIDLVPLGEKFDKTTALLTYHRFWRKQVTIQPSYFGDYEVLYVRYPGLPLPPPSSDVGIIDDGPYSGTDGNARTIKPLGADVGKRRHKDGLSVGIVVIIVLSASLAVVLFSAAAWVSLFKRRGRVCQPAPTSQVSPPSLTKPSGTAGSLIGSRHGSASLSLGSSIATYTGSAKTFSTNDIERATNHFDASRILGEGGFGCVYSGVLEDGTRVAVKVLKRDDQQGGREFLAEVEMLSRLHHRNLVKLIGICTEERARCLVYELMTNGSVESHLHGVDKETSPLNWVARMKIALGAARGLAYLHEDSSPRVIHRDFKSSNILLEDDFTPKVSDFGLARAAMDEENRHISTRVMGTFGYVAPEYAMTGHLLVKSDVYSYGVVLLELLTGRKPVDMSQPPGQENLVAWARPLLTSKEGLEIIIDHSLGSDAPFDSVAKVAAIASMCVQPEVSHRPFMSEVVQALKLVCNEFEEAKEIGSRSCSQEDLSIDLGCEASSASGQLPHPLQSQFLVASFDHELDTERGMSASDLYSASGGLRREQSGSFRRHSSSGPLASGSGRVRQFWQKMRGLSGGSARASRHLVFPNKASSCKCRGFEAEIPDLGASGENFAGTK